MADLQQALGERWEKKRGDMGRDAHERGAGVTASTETGTKGAAAGHGQHATNRSWWLLAAHPTADFRVVFFLAVCSPTTSLRRKRTPWPAKRCYFLCLAEMETCQEKDHSALLQHGLHMQGWKK